MIYVCVCLYDGECGTQILTNVVKLLTAVIMSVLDAVRTLTARSPAPVHPATRCLAIIAPVMVRAVIRLRFSVETQ